MSNPYMLFLTKEEITKIISERLSSMGNQLNEYPDRLEFVEVSELIEELDEVAMKVIEIKSVLEQIQKRG